MGDVYAIINPISGRRNLADIVRDVRARLAHAGIGLTCLVTAGRGDATRLAHEVPDKARAILVVGGDGTIRDVVNARVHRPTPLVVLSSGTENIVAKALRMPRDSASLVRRILEGRPRPLDVGVVNGRNFLIVSGIGFDAEVVHRLHATRDGHISHLDYFWPIWRTFWGHEFPSLRVEVDAQLLFSGRGLVFVGVLSRYSLGLQLLVNAKPDDGLLDVCVYPCETRRRLLYHSFLTLLRKQVTSGNAVYGQGTSITVTASEPVPMQVDGDTAGALPAEYSIVPRGVSFLALPPS